MPKCSVRAVQAQNFFVCVHACVSVCVPVAIAVRRIPNLAATFYFVRFKGRRFEARPTLPLGSHSALFCVTLRAIWLDCRAAGACLCQCIPLTIFSNEERAAFLDRTVGQKTGAGLGTPFTYTELFISAIP